MRTRLKSGEAGNSIVEFALVFLPLLLMIIAGCDIARGMWLYGTLANSIKAGTRYVATHGAGCSAASNNCAVAVGATVQYLLSNGIGLDPSQLQLTFTSGTNSLTCSSASSCLNSLAAWPPTAANAVGMPVQIVARYNFNPLVSAWCGPSCGSLPFVAESAETILF